MNGRGHALASPIVGRLLPIEPMWLRQARDTLDYLRYEDLVWRDPTSTAERRAHLASVLNDEADGYSTYLKACAQALVSPISRLPPEVLVSIFKSVARIDQPRKRHKYCSSDEPSTLGWVRISHVSRLWRELCLRTPDLWALHLAVLPDALPDFLERVGGDVPLDVCVKLLNLVGYQEDFQEVILEHLVHRLRTLTWSALRVSTFEAIFSGLQATVLPVLKSLELEYVPQIGLREVSFHRPYDRPMVAPNATSISLTECFIPFAAPALTLLCVERVKLPCEYLLTLMSEVPRLEDLQLLSCLISGDFEGSQVAALPRLRKLTLHRDPDMRPVTAKSFRWLLEHLFFPARAFLNISYECPDSAEDLGYIVPAVRSIWREDPPVGIEFDNFDFALYSGPLPQTCQALRHPFDFKGTDQGTERASLYCCAQWQFAQGLATCLPVQTQFASLTVFSASMSQWDADDWPRVFQTVPNLRTLHLYHEMIVYRWDSDDEVEAEIDDDDSTKDVFMALASLSVDTSISGTNAILPHLDLLWLTRQPYTTRRSIVNEPRLLRYLCTAIKGRAALNAPALGTLRLDIVGRPRDGQSGEVHAHILRELVKDVRWAAADDDGEGSSDENMCPD
ncbi:hypothetical protein PENSPDRAFT_754740 [Peniophora sp. CONT]|nr:hypothetical protein PENSPDRAFT_754740 [Peniophora sp. CONT]